MTITAEAWRCKIITGLHCKYLPLGGWGGPLKIKGCFVLAVAIRLWVRLISLMQIKAAKDWPTPDTVYNVFVQNAGRGAVPSYKVLAPLLVCFYVAYSDKHPRKPKFTRTESKASAKFYAALRTIIQTAPNIFVELDKKYIQLEKDKILEADLLETAKLIQIKKLWDFFDQTQEIAKWEPKKLRKSASTVWHPIAFKMAELIEVAFQEAGRKEVGLGTSTGSTIVIICKLLEIIGWHVTPDAVVKAIARHRAENGQKKN